MTTIQIKRLANRILEASWGSRKISNRHSVGLEITRLNKSKGHYRIYYDTCIRDHSDKFELGGLRTKCSVKDVIELKHVELMLNGAVNEAMKVDEQAFGSGYASHLVYEAAARLGENFGQPFRNVALSGEFNSGGASNDN